MQERDEDLYWAYQDIDELELKVAKKDNAILKLIIAVVILGVIILGIGVFAIIKLWMKIKTPILTGRG